MILYKKKSDKNIECFCWSGGIMKKISRGAPKKGGHQKEVMVMDFILKIQRSIGGSRVVLVKIIVMKMGRV